jgi:hypothetical protein
LHLPDLPLPKEEHVPAEPLIKHIPDQVQMVNGIQTSKSLSSVWMSRLPRHLQAHLSSASPPSNKQPLKQPPVPAEERKRRRTQRVGVHMELSPRDVLFSKPEREEHEPRSLPDAIPLGTLEKHALPVKREKPTRKLMLNMSKISTKGPGSGVRVPKVPRLNSIDKDIKTPKLKFKLSTPTNSQPLHDINSDA